MDRCQKQRHTVLQKFGGHYENNKTHSAMADLQQRERNLCERKAQSNTGYYQMNSKTRKKLQKIREKQARVDVVNSILREVVGELKTVKKELSGGENEHVLN